MRVQQNVQLQHRFLIRRLLHMKHRVLDHIAFHHDHRQDLMVIHPGQLNEFQLIPMIERRRYHCRIICIRCQKLRHMLKKVLHLVFLLHKQPFEVIHLSVLLLQHTVHIQTVALIRRNTSGRGMGLDDIAKLFQIRHLVPDRSRTQIQIRVLGNRPASHRLSRFQVVPDDRMQDLHFPLIQFSFHLTVTPFRVVSTQPIRVLTPSDSYIITSPTRCQRIFYFFYKPRSHPKKAGPENCLQIFRP